MVELMTWIFAAALVAGLGVGVYAAGFVRGWWVRAVTVDELARLLAPHIRVHRPDGPGPFPAVLQLHGCGGVKDIQHEYAQTAADAGVLAVVLDSLAPRGIDYAKALKTVCKGRRLLGAERAGDVVAGLKIVRAMEDVDPERIALAGWSHGGWAIMDLLAMRPPREKPPSLKDLPDAPFAGVRGAYLVYPFCAFPALSARRGWARADIPASMLLVENDAMADDAKSRAAAERARASGAEVEVEAWPGLTHAFDEPTHAALSRLRYDPAAAQRAHRRYADWLARTLDARPATAQTTETRP